MRRLLIPLLSPLSSALLLSLTLFLPWVVMGTFPLLEDSSFQNSVTSIDTTIVLGACLSMTFPILLDLLLDYIFLDVTHIEIRICTILSICISNIAVLTFRQSTFAATAAITFTTWSYFVGFCCIQLLTHYWLQNYFPLWKMRILIVLHFILSILNLWNSIFLATAFAFTILHYILFASIVLLMGHSFHPWLMTLVKSYRESKLGFFHWLETVPTDEVCALALKFAALCVIVGRSILLILFPSYPNTPSITLHTWICLEVIRNVSALLTYTIPSRICRATAIKSERMIGVKTEFIKFISHELRSPMGVILSGVELLANLQLTEEQAEHMDDIRVSSAVVVDILDDLLLYEKIERGQIEMNFRVVRAYSLFRRIVDEFKHPAITLHSECNTETNFIRADRAKIRMVLHALIGPALHDSEGKVEISLDCLEDQGELESEKKSSHSAANPFLSKSRISPYLTDESKQCVVTIRCCYKVKLSQKKGLGNREFSRIGRDDHDASAFKLWIAQELIRLHGARVTVNEDIAYVQHKIVLPCVSGVQAVEESLKSQNSHPQESRRRLESCVSRSSLPFIGENGLIGIDSTLRRSHKASSLNILIVDDSSMVRKMTAKLLTSLEHSCDVAQDGVHAVSKVRDSLRDGTSYDVILMDNQMPNMMGYEATKLIRQIGFTGVILGVTGNALESDIQQFLQFGADNVIVKPLTKENFERCLNVRAANRFCCEGI